MAHAEMWKRLGIHLKEIGAVEKYRALFSRESLVVG
jgi:hypothetical protein